MVFECSDPTNHIMSESVFCDPSFIKYNTTYVHISAPCQIITLTGAVYSTVAPFNFTGVNQWKVSYAASYILVCAFHYQLVGPNLQFRADCYEV